MDPVLSRDEMRAFDRHAIDQSHVPGLILMENAGRGAAEALRREIEPDRRVLIVCGVGNNGGDGFVVARQLAKRGASVRVALLGSSASLGGDAAIHQRAWSALGGVMLEVDEAAGLTVLLQDSDVVVDAMFGTGLSRPVEGLHREAIEQLNASGLPSYALDIPSGLDANSGAVLGVAVRARATFTFGHPKLGLFTSHAHRYTGKVVVVDIGVPSTLVPPLENSAWLVQKEDVVVALDRVADSFRTPAHKGEAGKVLIFAGSPETLGAARLTAHGALRAGAGLVKVATWGAAATALQASNWEVMTSSLDGNDASLLEQLVNWADAIVMGPGFGSSDEARRTMSDVLRNASVPVVIDADGLTHFAAALDVVREAKASVLLTPHPAEAARLLGSSSDEVERDRFRAIAELTQKTGAAVLLKGVYTLVAHRERLGGKPTINTTGTPALASAGAGDVLSGMLGALCCHLEPQEAAYVGAWLHGRCAEHWRAKTKRNRGVLAHEIADALPEVVSELLG